MPTTYDGATLQPIHVTATRVDANGNPIDADGLPVITVQARFPWKFWAGVAVALLALHALGQSMKRAARHG